MSGRTSAGVVGRGLAQLLAVLAKADGMVVGYFEADDVELAQQRSPRPRPTQAGSGAMSQFFAAPDGGTNEVLPQYFHLA